MGVGAWVARPSVAPADVLQDGIWTASPRETQQLAVAMWGWGERGGDWCLMGMGQHMHRCKTGSTFNTAGGRTGGLADRRVEGWDGDDEGGYTGTVPAHARSLQRGWGLDGWTDGRINSCSCMLAAIASPTTQPHWPSGWPHAAPHHVPTPHLRQPAGPESAGSPHPPTSRAHTHTHTVHHHCIRGFPVPAYPAVAVSTPAL